MPDPSVKHKNKRLLIILLIGVVFMFGFCYMLVPLYKLICEQEGINGRSANRRDAVASHLQVDYSRTIKVGFTTTLHGGLAFEFKPLQHYLMIHPGERKLVYFYAQNNAGHDITVQAVPSITPNESARYLKKTECFCFTQQYFFNHEKADMPVYFFIDPDVPKEIKEITLSYTLFDASAFLKKQQRVVKGRIDV